MCSVTEFGGCVGIVTVPILLLLESLDKYRWEDKMTDRHLDRQTDKRSKEESYYWSDCRDFLVRPICATVRVSYVMISSKLEQVGQLALNYKCCSRSVHYINGFVRCFDSQKQTDRWTVRMTEREMNWQTDRLVISFYGVKKKTCSSYIPDLWTI